MHTYYTARDCLHRVSVIIIYIMCLRSPRPSRCLLRNNDDFERSWGVDEPISDKSQVAPLEIRPSCGLLSKSRPDNRPGAFRLHTRASINYNFISYILLLFFLANVFVDIQSSGYHHLIPLKCSLNISNLYE